MYLPRSGCYDMPRQPTWQDGVTSYLEKLEKAINEGLGSVNKKIDTIYNLEIANVRDRLTRLEAQAKIVFAILAAIGLALVGALVKYIVK